MEALRVEGLSKKFGGLQVLTEVSFTIEVGEKVALIGPNGAGKTTLINLLSGELSPTAGRIYLLGQEVTTMPAHRRIHLGLGRSFQVPTLFTSLTLLEAILLAIQGTKPSRYQMLRPITSYQDTLAQAKKLLGTLGLWEKRYELMQTLSHGELRGMELSLSLASQPKVLLLDEPSAGLTKAETDTLINMIQGLAKDTTVLFVAHDMDMVFGLAKRIIVLYFGRVIAQGTPEEIQRDSKVKEIYLGTEESAANAGIS